MDAYLFPDDAFRLFIVVTGMLICAVCFKVCGSALMRRDWENASATLAFGLFVIAPASGSILNFGSALSVPFATLYIAGLIAALVALYFRVRISAPWLHVSRRGRRRRDADALPRKPRR